MKRKFTLLIAALMLLTMMATTGEMWGQTRTDQTAFYGFESGDAGWTATTFVTNNTAITAHGGSKYGATNGTTADVKYNSIVATPLSLTCYYSKTTTNTNASSKFTIQVSSNGTTWTTVATGLGMDKVTKGTWYELSADLSSYSNVYVRVRYDGTTGVRALDDITLTYDDGQSPSTDPVISFTPASVTLGDVLTNNETSTTFTVSQSNLEEGITLNVDNGELSQTSIDKDADPISITWTYTPTTAGAISATVTATSGETSQTLEISGTAIAPVEGYDVDFEYATNMYPNWEFVNMTTLQTGSVTAHGGTHYGTTGGKSTASVTTESKVANPGTLTCYVTKQSGNTTASSWYIQVSSDGSSWTDVETQDATSMSQGTWVEFSADLSSYSDVYVRVYYSGSTAIRNIDDISLTEASNALSVTYNGNGNTGGTVPTDDNEYESGDEVTVLGNTGNLAKAGYVWSGWCMNAEGTGTVYGPDYTTTFEISANTTLYAKWDAKTITNLTYSGTPTATQYAGQAFNPAGLTVTATFNDESEEDVTSQVVWTPNSLTIGTTSVTGTYMGQTVLVEGITVTYAPGTVNNPYTVADAMAAIDAQGTINEAYVTGIVSQVDSYSSQYHSITYWISDDGTATDQLEVYSGKGLNGADFSSVADVQVGATVVVKGKLKLYNQTYEFDYNNELVSYTAPVVTVEAPTFSVAAGGYAEAKTVEIACATDGAIIKYSYDNETWNDYSEALTINETKTVYAKAIKDAGESTISSAAYYILSNENTNTVTQALAFASYPQNNVFVQGIVSTAPTSLISGGMLTYYISADGTSNELHDNELQVYKGKNLNNTDFKGVDLAVGDRVTIFGNVTIYNNTKEFDQGNYLVSLEAYQMPVINANNINIACDATSGTINYTIEPYVAGTMTAETKVDWISNFNTNTFGQVSFTTTANDTEEARVATVTLTYQDISETIVNKVVTVTQAPHVNDYAELPLWFNGNRDDIATTNGLTQYGLGEDFGNEPHLNFDNEGDWVILKMNEAPGRVSFTISNEGFSSGTFKVQTSADGETYSDLAVYTEINNYQDKTYYNLDENVRYIKWIYTENGNGSVGLGSISVDKFVSPIQVYMPNPDDPSQMIISYTFETSSASYQGYWGLQINNTNIESLDQYSIVFCHSDGTLLEPTEQAPDWLLTNYFYNLQVNEYYATCTYYFTINANTSTSPREAYFRFKCVIDETSYYSLPVTVTQAGYVPQNYTVTFNTNGGEFVTNQDFSSTSTNVVEGEHNLPSATKDGYTFMGWSDGTQTYAANAIYNVTGNVEFTAQWGSFEWVATPLADLTADDVFVIVGNNGDTYAMSNDNGTNSAPTAVAVTVEDNKLSGNIDANIQWNLSISDDGYMFYPNGDSESWLYCTNANNGLRIGTGDNKHFSLANDGYITITETTKQRYLGIYNSQDWRSYENTTGNIANQTFAFYKRVEASTEPSITLSSYEINAPANETIEILTITPANIENFDVNNLSADYCNADGSDIEGSKPNFVEFGFSENEGYKLTCTIANNTGEARTAHFKVIYNNGGTDVVSNVVTVNQAEYVAPVATITVAGGDANIDVDANGVENAILAIAYENLTITENTDFDIQYYDEDGNELEKDDEPIWMAASIQENSTQDGYEVLYDVFANDGEARTAYFKVFAMGSEDFVYSNLVTVSQAAVPATMYTVNFNLDGGTFVPNDYFTDEIVEIEAGTYTLPSATKVGYDFTGWNDGDQTYAAGAEYTVSDDVDFTAQWTESTTVTYELVTSNNDIVSGAHYYIAGVNNLNAWFAMGQQKTNNRQAESVTVSNNSINQTDNVHEVVISSYNDGFYSIFDEDSNASSYGYLYAAGGTNNNYLKTYSIDNYDERGQWTISIDAETHVATITANITGRNIMRFNNGSSCFSCYASGQSPIYLFKKVDNSPSISADNVDIAYNETSGSIYYTINNYVEGTMVATTEADWISDFTYEQVEEISTVDFTATANTSYESRSATVTLTYSYGDPAATVTKDVTVTQAAAPIPTYIVSFIVGEGGTFEPNEDFDEEIIEVEAGTYTLPSATKEGYTFDGWNDGEQTYAAGASYEVSDDVEFTATYTALPTYTVSFWVNGDIDNDLTETGSSIDLPTTSARTPDGFAIYGWALQNSIEAVANPYVPTADVTLYALLQLENTPTVLEKYVKVTEELTDWSGEYLIAYSDDTFADGRIGGTGENGIGAQYVSVDLSSHISNNTISRSIGDSYKVTLEEISEGSKTYVLKTQDGKYNYQTSNNNGLLATENKETAASYPISVTFTSENDIKLCLGGNATGAVFRYNTSGYFRYYKNGGQNAVYLYKKVSETVTPTIVNVEYVSGITPMSDNIPESTCYIVEDGAVLTFTGTNEGTAANIVVQEGGQLIHEADVEATVQKGVSAYTSKSGDGWYLISSPVDGISTSAVATGTYDLFAYDEETAYWWVDHAIPGQPANHTFTTLKRGKGYLYANAADVNLNYAGTTKATNANITVDLSYACEYPDFKGFNLVGNPFTRNITATDMVIGENEVTSYYDFNADRTEFVTYLTEDRPIQPGQGFFIQATANAQQLEFNPTTSKDASVFKYISISAGDESFTDKAYIQLGYGNTLRKMTFGENTMVYVMNNDEDYAAARVEELAGMMPVHFVPVEDGTYTITVETKNIENINYMRLIDNIDNVDIDLLVEPTYTFKACTPDDANRFTLLFDFNIYTGVNENYTNANFAYQIGDEIFVSGEGTLQVFDMLGRFVADYDVNGDKRISTSAFNNGVYIFRMVGTEMKTQKIVVR